MIVIFIFRKRENAALVKRVADPLDNGWNKGHASLSDKAEFEQLENPCFPDPIMGFREIPYPPY